MSSTTEAYVAHHPYEEFASSKHGEELTPASVWDYLTGSTISDEFLDWPADVFCTFGSHP